MNYFSELLSILNEMSPYLLLGFLISGILHVYVPKKLYNKFLHRKGIQSVIGAALLGVPLPLCSCGVIPTAVSLKKEGASDGATVAFLVGTPQTGIDSILATYSLLGLPFAIIRPVVSFLVGIFAGVLVDLTKRVKPKKKFTYMGSQTSTSSCTCGCTSHKEAPKKSIKAVFHYGYVTMMQDFGKWLILGLLVAAAITAFIPESVFTLFKHYYLLNLLLILAISTPMYICATGSLPIALSLMLKGVSPGAAFVLLLAGPATNFATLIILKREIGLSKTIVYLVSIITGAIVSAYFIDFVLPDSWFATLQPLSGCAHDHCHEHCSHGPIWWQTTTSIIFCALFINSIYHKYAKKERKNR